jgi:hypothetical protein
MHTLMPFGRWLSMLSVQFSIRLRQTAHLPLGRFVLLHSSVLFSAFLAETLMNLQLDDSNPHRLTSWRLADHADAGAVPSALCLPPIAAQHVLVASTTGSLTMFDAAAERAVRVMFVIFVTCDLCLCPC